MPHILACRLPQIYLQNHGFSISSPYPKSSKILRCNSEIQTTSTGKQSKFSPSFHRSLLGKHWTVAGWVDLLQNIKPIILYQFKSHYRCKQRSSATIWWSEINSKIIIELDQFVHHILCKEVYTGRHIIVILIQQILEFSILL